MLTKRLPFLVTLFALACTTIAPPPPPDPAVGNIDRFVAEVLAEMPELPGVSIAVVRDGRPLLVRGYGLADAGRRLPMDAQTGVYIASSTKSFTALTAAILAERGTIDLDAPLGRYLPEMKLPPQVDPEALTLRRLLTHRIGIQNDPIVFRTAFSGEHTMQQIVELVARSKPGKDAFVYDNLGYVLAATAMERATGTPWQRLLDEVLFRPAGLERTTAYVSALKDPVASPHQTNRDGRLGRATIEKSDQTMHAAGGLFTTAGDLARWLELQTSEGRIDGRQIVPAAVMAEAHRQQTNVEASFDRYKRTGYALGWYHSDYEGELLLHHFGGFGGWSSHVSFMPKHRIGVAVVANTSGLASNSIHMIASYAYDRLLGRSDVEAKYRKELDQSKAANATQRDRLIAGVAERAKRPPTLLHDAGAYTGHFRNASYGTIHIVRKADGLTASVGSMSGTLEPFTEPETARVELIPGNGEVIRFVFSVTVYSREGDGRDARVRTLEILRTGSRRNDDWGNNDGDWRNNDDRRLNGIVVSVDRRGRSLVMETENDRTVTVDLSDSSDVDRSAFRRGDRISVTGRMNRGTFVADEVRLRNNRR